MGFNYEKLPKCEGCPIFEKGDDRTRCALHWRPGTGTKAGFPKKDGWECPRSDTEKYKTVPIEIRRQFANSYLDLFIPK